MYIFELIAKLKEDYKNKKYMPLKQGVSKESEKTVCSHIFVPIDSTKKVLACSKCGLLIKRENLDKLKNKNFFIKD